VIDSRRVDGLHCAELVVAVALLVALVGSPARAQMTPPTTDSQGNQKERGLDLDPSVSAGLYYDSNVYRAKAPAEGDLALLVIPSLTLRYLGPSLEANLAVDYQLRKFMNLGLRRPDTHNDLDIYGNAGLASTLRVGSTRRVGFDLSETFRSSSRALDSSERPDNQYSLVDRMTNDLGLLFHLRPGSALDLAAGAEHRLEYASTREGGGGIGRVLNYGLSHDLAARLRVRWAFFPRTALVVDAQGGQRLWSVFVDLFENPLGLTVLQLPAVFWRALAGVEGRLGSTTTVRLMLGYGGAYFGEDYDDQSPEERARTSLVGARGVLARGQFIWEPTERHRLVLGYQRDYSFTYFATFYMSNRPYFEYVGRYLDWLTVTAGLGLNFRALSGAPDVQDGIREDLELEARLVGKAAVLEWLSVSLEYRPRAILRSEVNTQVFEAHQLGVMGTAAW
jgi:hypothetical protein